MALGIAKERQWQKEKGGKAGWRKGGKPGGIKYISSREEGRIQGKRDFCVSAPAGDLIIVILNHGNSKKRERQK